TQILYLLAGEKFIEAAPILRITAFFGFMLPFLKQFGTVIDATGNPRLNFRLMFSGCLINILTNILFVHFWGVTGAAIGTFTTYLVLFVISQVILKRKFGISLTNVIENTVLIYFEIWSGVMLFIKKCWRRGITYIE